MGKKATLTCFLLFFIVAISSGSSKLQKSITFELQRNVLGAWAQNSSKYSNDFCYSPKASRPKNPRVFNVNMPSNCSNARVSRISQECVFKNLAYNVRFYYDAVSNSTITTSETSPKKLENSNEYVDLAVDLTSPWTWIKSPVCQTCDRRGKNCQSQCKYSFNSSLVFDRSYTCENCQILQKCGEIDSYAEGMSVVGQFVLPEKLKFKKAQQALLGAKFLWAHALSGQEYLMADGVLGLGVEKNMHSETLKGFSKDVQESGSPDTFRSDDSTDNDIDEDEEEDNSSNSQNDWEKINKDEEEEPKQKFDYFEPEMNILAPVVSQFNGIKEKIFSLYIADDDSLKYTLTFGAPVEKYIFQPEKNKVLWVSSMVSAELLMQYGLWVINLQNIRIARVTEELKKKIEETKNDEDSASTFDRSEYLTPLSSISVGNPHSILSLSTTAIVLPKKELDQIIEIFKNEFGLECEVSKKYLFFVVCDNVSSPKEDLSDLTLIIEVGYHSTVHLQVNPEDLILNCKKKSKAKDSKYTCQMNLQESYDDKIILGEAALKNQYLLFDQTSNLIGFAPAKNIFNNASFVRKITHLFNQLEEVFEQDALYIALFLGLIISSFSAYIFYRHGKTIIALLKGKRVIVLDDKNDRIKLANQNPDTMDEQSFQELQQVNSIMEDSGIQENASHPNDAIKPINLEDL